MKTIAVVGALDTKERENIYLSDQIRKFGCKVYLIDVGVLGDPDINPHVTAGEVASLGGADLYELRQRRNREKSLEIMAHGAALAVRRAYDARKIDGVVAMGGGQGTYVAAHVMRSLPIGFPKVMVSTIATSAFDQQQFEGINDTMVINPLVDVAGNNSIICMIMDRAAAAISGMAQYGSMARKINRHKIGITMWGVTTACVKRIEDILTENGYEVLIFHATGLGGRAMEDLIRQGELEGVIDLTLAELGNQVTGGTFAKCEYRCETAGRMGIPQIVVPGGLDMIKYVPPENLPEKFKGRKRYMHNANLLFVRSNESENRIIGKTIAEKLNQSIGQTTVILPLKGISSIDKEGEVFYDPVADRALFDTLREELDPSIKLVEYDMHINDMEFAKNVADFMLKALKYKKGERK